MRSEGKNMKKTLMIIIYVCLGLFFLVTFIFSLGAVMLSSKLNINNTPTVTEKVVPVEKNYHLEKEIVLAMGSARTQAYKYASSELDKWIAEMMALVDNDFLDDYYDLISVKRREILSVYNTVKHVINKRLPDAEEAAMLELEDKISEYIIRPEISQARIKNITDRTVEIYLEVFDNELSNLQTEYNIPVLDWNKYIKNVCGLTENVDSKTYPISVKTMVVSGTALTGMVVVPVVKLAVKKVSAELAAKAAVKTAEKTAVKVGVKAAGKTAAKGGAKVAGKAAAAIPVAGLGIAAAICVWDIVDYNRTAAKGKEVLRRNLKDYFKEVKLELMGNTEHSVMGSITMWENTLKRNISEYCDKEKD